MCKWKIKFILNLADLQKKQNCHIWGTENHHTCIEKPTHPKRVTVWCWFWTRGIIGPYFFENQQGEAVTVNGDRYRAISNEFLLTEIEEEDIGNIWFEWDGALSTGELIKFGHPGAAIWHRWTIWWGAVKDKFYANKAETTDALKVNLREAIDIFHY